MNALDNELDALTAGDSGWSTEFFKQLSEGFFLLGGHVKDPALAGTLQEAAAILSDQCDCLLTDGGESDCDSAYCPHDQPQRTHEVLVPIISSFRPFQDALPDLMLRLSQRAQTSQEKWEKHDLRASAAIRQWLVDYAASPAEIVPPELKKPGGPVLLELPPEIIADIVMMAQVDDHDVHLTLSLVHPALRTLVLTTPLLWCLIDIMHPLSRMKTSLSRSDNAPLDVAMSIPPMFRWEQVQARMDQVIPVLRPHFHRVRHLDIAQYWSTWAAHAINVFLTDSSSSELQTLNMGTQYQMIFDDALMIPGTAYPHARSLRLRNVDLRHIDNLLHPALKKLCIAEPHNLTRAGFTGILNKIPSLEYLALEEVKPKPLNFPALDGSGPAAILEKLRTLELVLPYWTSFNGIASTITAQNLDGIVLTSDIAVELPDSLRTEYGDALFHFTSTYSHISTLDLSGCIILPQSWSKILRGLPGLIYLRLAGCDLRSAHLAALEEESPFACPNLEEIVLDNEFDLHSSFVRDLVTVRQSSSEAANIRNVTMRGWYRDNVTQDDVVAIRGMVEKFTLGVFGDGPSYESDDDDGSDEASDSDSLGSAESDGWTSGDERVLHVQSR